MIKANLRLDVKGLSCPMPIVKTKKAIVDLKAGDVLEVQATDKGSKADIAAWAEAVGHQYLGTKEDDDVLYHYIRKASAQELQGQSFNQTIQNEKILDQTGVILDVREPAEYAFDHIPGAVSIPLGELKVRMNELSQSENIYVICRTGSRSALAAQQLVDAGFEKVYNVLPGMVQWQGKTTNQEDK